MGSQVSKGADSYAEHPKSLDGGSEHEEKADMLEFVTASWALCPQAPYAPDDLAECAQRPAPHAPPPSPQRLPAHHAAAPTTMPAAVAAAS